MRGFAARAMASPPSCAARDTRSLRIEAGWWSPSVSEANGTAGGAEGLKLLDSLPKRGRRRTVGCDKGYDGREFVRGCRERRFTPNAAARKSGRGLMAAPPGMRDTG